MIYIATIVLRIFAAGSTTAQGACSQSSSFFGLPTWYKYLPQTTDAAGVCSFKVDFSNGLNQVWLIGLGVIDILLWLVGLIAVGFVIYAGFQYITSQGESDKTRAAKDTILNALIGLTIAVLASTIVRFIGTRLGTSGATGGDGVLSALPQTTTDNTIQTVMQIVFGIIGAASVIMIIIAGYQYVLSGGDSQKVAKAKNTIIYSVIGLVIAISAETIVHFVMGKV